MNYFSAPTQTRLPISPATTENAPTTRREGLSDLGSITTEERKIIAVKAYRQTASDDNYYTRSIHAIYLLVNRAAAKDTGKEPGFFDKLEESSHKWYNALNPAMWAYRVVKGVVSPPAYSINYVSQIIDAYVTAARTYYNNARVQPKIPFYGSSNADNTKVANYIVGALTNKPDKSDNHSDGRVRAVLASLEYGVLHKLVHPAVLRPEQANVEQNSPAVELFLQQQKQDADDAGCKYFGIDVCKIGKGVKYTAYAALGLGAIYVGTKAVKIVRTAKRDIS